MLCADGAAGSGAPSATQGRLPIPGALWGVLSRLPPVTLFSSLHSGRRRLHGGLLCRWTSNGHRAQGLLAALRLGIQGMQVCLPALHQKSAPLDKSRRGRESGWQTPGERLGARARLWAGGCSGAADPCLPPSSVPPRSSYMSPLTLPPPPWHYRGILTFHQAARKKIWVCSPCCHSWAL